jgi:hypothetical protein
MYGQVAGGRVAIEGMVCKYLAFLIPLRTTFLCLEPELMTESHDDNGSSTFLAMPEDVSCLEIPDSERSLL